MRKFLWFISDSFRLTSTRTDRLKMSLKFVRIQSDWLARRCIDWDIEKGCTNKESSKKCFGWVSDSFGLIPKRCTNRIGQKMIHVFNSNSFRLNFKWMYRFGRIEVFTMIDFRIACINMKTNSGLAENKT